VSENTDWLTQQQRQRDTLAPWTYLSAEYHELETELFKQQWMLVGHISSLRNRGDYLTFEAVGERALIVVDEEENLRAFHNVCRHRGARLLAGNGNCSSRITCPFHGWSYSLGGSLRGVPLPDTFKSLVKEDHGLRTIALEVWQGFVFISFNSQVQSVADRLRSVTNEVLPYCIADMQPLTPGFEYLRPYNWKVIHDIDNEGYHVPVGHPSLQQLYGSSYCDRIEEDIPISDALINDKIGNLWSVYHYQKLLPHFEHLPAHRQKSWWYIGLFPNAVIALYPDMIEYYMTVPVSVNETRYIGQQFGLTDKRRETRAARYLNMRINGITDTEDESFVSDMQEGMRSSAFPEPTFSSTEIGVQHFHRKIQTYFPVARLHIEPPPGTVSHKNAELLQTGKSLL